MRILRPFALALAFGLTLTTGASALVYGPASDIAGFRDPSINIANAYQPLAALAPEDAAALADALAALGVAPGNAFVDVRSNRWGTLMPAMPLIPGGGVGNDLDWETLGAAAPANAKELERAVWKRFVEYLSANAESLRVDVADLPQGKVTVHGAGDLIQIWAPRVHDGIQVRDSSLTAVVNRGNLILFGAIKWGDVETPGDPAITAAQAFAALAGRIEQPVVFQRKAAYLEYVPTAAGETLADVEPGRGYGHVLAWVLSPKIEGDAGRWEALVDAHTGDVLALQDLNQYAGGPAQRRVQGGVLPVSNDGVPPDGVEQAGWPMPWADLTVLGNTVFADAGGNLPFCSGAVMSTSLDGQFMRMNDNCGPISDSTGADILDLGTSAGTDCTVPPGGSPGNTHASRSGFHELNQVKAQARGQLPGNLWPQGVLQANMNINSTCNAFWDGSTVNFYRSGGGCANTGELAGVYDHEWGHGMDNFDAVPTISNPGEGIADIYAALRLNDSCMGRNFLPGNCSGYGDPCTQCSGVRDIDWANRASGQPHDITSPFPVGIDALCGSGGGTPCGGPTHCEGAVYAEAVWDLFNRDLPTAGVDHVTAIEIAARLTYLGGGMANNWFQCVPNFGGCNADGGYLNFLAADDDDGDLANGTPNMQVIFDAFDRHEIACNVPTVQNGGCAGGPSTAPAIAVTALDKGALVDIQTVPAGTVKYDVYRTDGVFGCDQGKIKVGSVDVPVNATESSLLFADEGLQNGREYWYTVIAVGSSDACRSPAATCTAVTPVPGPNLNVREETGSFTFNTGDGDVFLDNCEESSLSFDVSNIGTGTQTNVRIVSVEFPSHPTSLLTVSLPAVIDNSMNACQNATGSISFQPRDMASDDTFVVEVGVTSDELGGVVKTGTFSIGFVESDLQSFASKNFDFEADENGWVVDQGTFVRTDAIGGANGTTWYEQSSAFLNMQCDVIRSPLMVVDPASTMSLYTNFDIEPMSAGTWYDRANIGFLDTGGTRTLLTPDGGRLYNADSSGPGTYGGCNEPEEGWADSMPVWDDSTWSAAAFGQVAPAGLAQLEVIYGTDPLANGDGFRFDEVTVTDIDLQVADGQTDVCMAPTFIFADGFESGDTSAWSNAVP